MKTTINQSTTIPGNSLGGQPVGRVPSLVGIGDLPGGLVISGATGLSGDGSVIGGFGFSDESDAGDAIRWTAKTGIQRLGDLPGGIILGTTFGVSTNGRVLVGASASEASANNATFPGIEAFRWTPNQGLVGLGDLPGGDFFSIALKTTQNGSLVVGSSSSEAGQEAFLWNSVQGIQGLGDLPGGEFLSLGNSISQNGRVVVGVSNSANGDEAFAWTRRDGMVALGDLAGGEFLSIAADVSKDGSVIVGRSASTNSSDGTPATPESGTEAFIWTQRSGMVGLGDLDGGEYFSRAIAVSAEGDIVVGQSATEDGGDPFIWDRFQGMRSLRTELEEKYGLSLADWGRIEVTDISDDGTTIIGFGENPNNDTEGWVATLGAIPLEGTAQGEVLHGTDQNDRMFGRQGKDVLLGHQGDDYLDGGSQSDVLLGMVGNDILVGGRGKDTLNGGSGDDTLDGGYGSDLLLGGAGRDRFLLSPDEGHDTIQDFQIGQDLIQLEGLAFDQLSFAQGQSALLVQDSQSQKTLLTLQGLTGTTLTQQDFITVIHSPSGLE